MSVLDLQALIGGGAEGRGKMGWGGGGHSGTESVPSRDAAFLTPPPPPRISYSYYCDFR